MCAKVLVSKILGLALYQTLQIAQEHIQGEEVDDVKMNVHHLMMRMER